VDALLCITVLCFMPMLLQVKVLSPQEILFRKEDKRAVVVDVRPADDYDEVTNPALAADCTPVMAIPKQCASWYQEGGSQHGLPIL
jgi:hypothetical protein